MPLFFKPKAESYISSLPPSLPDRTTSFLGDVFNSEAPPAEVISAGIYQEFTNVGNPLVYEYTYDEMKVCLEVYSPKPEEPAHFYVSDEEGYKVEVTPHDILYFKKGCKITFEVTGPEGSYAKNFFTGLREADGA